MSIIGFGSGLDILKQMAVNGLLYNVWVMFDMMHRLTDDWIMMSAHVYDHNY